ncbi:serine hydrolase domain-containing protein [Sphingobium boeckii]|uniref:CubicO group peptidase (Beta-lactamase class C family) n=1 Tax=Sphingobium boeckii TaxID=1082345 RepID=A0A7W9AHQ9_9SPHN|nr:serine hydrolase [Sphingobium boeckii]MBB5685636.1 CubicO group peptidase (beta-lactamase class C family) [Sphingobium boeckii]
MPLFSDPIDQSPRRALIVIAALALAATPAAAQKKPPTSYDRAIAAGYKALTLCSGIFNVGRTQAQIEALELTGIYPEYDAIVPTLEAKVEKSGGGHTGAVTVAFDDKLPPRAANWTMNRGCTIAPIGRSGSIALIKFQTPPVDGSGAQDQAKWPLGEAGLPVKIKAPAKLAATLSNSFESAAYGAGIRTTGTIVLRDGRIIAERYAEGFGIHTSQRTWSVAKSLTGTLAGALAYRGVISIEAQSGIPEWQTGSDPRAAITLDQLLRMASGLHSNTAGNRTDALYFGGSSVTQETVAWPLDALPGTRFRYANNDIVLAMRAIRARLDDDGAYAGLPQDLFGSIGMTRTVAETDWQGNFILSSQVWSTARDLARFGLLYLNDGVWNGERILPQGWVKYVTTPSGPQPDGPFGYGATFWLMSKSPGVPADTYAAFGNRGQFVVIVPSRKIVIVRRGEDPAGANFDIAKFTADVLAALQ